MKKGSFPRSLRALVVFPAALLALTLLAGCAARTPAAEGQALRRGLVEAASPSPAEGFAAAPESSRAAASGSAAEQAGSTGPTLPAQLPAQRMVIRTATLEVRVRDVAAAFDRAVRLTESAGGYVQASSQESLGGERADLTLRIGPERFLPLLDALAGLGAVQSRGISGEDVTEEYYDLDAQLGNLNAVRSRLLTLLARATKVPDAVEVERELERVGGELNRIEGRMRYLNTMVGLSTINLTLAGEERPAAEPFINWAFVGNGFVVAARVLVQVLFFILQALVVVIPVGVVAAAAAYGIWRLVRVLRRRPHGRGSAARGPTARGRRA